MINLASPGDLKCGLAIGSMRKSYIHVSYYKLYGQVQQSASNRRGSDNLLESLSGQCSTEASGQCSTEASGQCSTEASGLWTGNYRDRPMAVCNCV